MLRIENNLPIQSLTNIVHGPTSLGNISFTVSRNVRVLRVCIFLDHVAHSCVLTQSTKVRTVREHKRRVGWCITSPRVRNLHLVIASLSHSKRIGVIHRIGDRIGLGRQHAAAVLLHQHRVALRVHHDLVSVKTTLRVLHAVSSGRHGCARLNPERIGNGAARLKRCLLIVPVDCPVNGIASRRQFALLCQH